jgi:hypothetical protein
MLSLLILLPVILFFLAALGIVILQQSRPGIGSAWLIAALTGLVVTGLMLFLRLRLPLEVVAERWLPFGENSSPPAFLLDYPSWAFALCLVVLALALVLTDSSRLETEARPLNWAAGLGLTGIGLLAVMARNPTTLVAAWTAVDLFELVIVLSTEAGRRMGQQTLTAFSVRLAGSLLVIAAILFARSRGIQFNLNPIPAELGIFMLLAAGLRLGVLPLNVPYMSEVYTWRGLGNLIRLIGPASSLMVLGRIPGEFLPPGWQPLLLGLSVLAALYGSMMWLTASNELAGRPYWSTAVAALAVASAIKGDARAAIAWGTAFLLVGSVLFYYSAHRRRNLFIPLLAVLGLTGIPFTPAAAGWSGLASGAPGISTFVFLLSDVLLIWGFLRHVLRPRDEIHRMERWVHQVYPAGLLFLIAAQWAIGWPDSFRLGTWWPAVVVVLLSAATIAAWITLQKKLAAGAVSVVWLGTVARQVGAGLGAFFRLNWLYRFLRWVYQMVQSFIQLVTTMLEGDGGILWTLVLLAILISLIWLRGRAG